ncbi:MAG TPA: maltose alpha-D-glucosyltransferase [Thermoanaerobaculia bacterium]|nr:maltose alpha-D-glucosyltransferase [Thermoanaerobaculia bacterium]
MIKKPTPLADDPLWYKDGIIYQVHVKAFYDSNADGIGDFAGLTEKLDYLQDLGVTAVWLLPFYPSPLKDDGYDIAGYTDVHTSYGSVRDFRIFLREAHRRGIRVITELVINHTSDQHPWFQRARRARPGSALRDFYVWTDDPGKYKETRIIFKDFEASNWTWDPVAKAYYWHRFFHHQPDLNFDNPAVHRAVEQALDFWMKMGVDGLRLDAVPYLFEREGTSCENLPETHEYLKELRRYVDSNYKNRMLLAEANQWPEDTRPYFGDGDECQVAFHFPLMPRLFMSVAMEDRFPIIDILKQTPDIPDNCQWALFLRNHDELTLEMVTDEDRDYMYRTYAQDRQARINLGIRRRLAPLLENHRPRIELLNGLLFSFPGTPFIYYGDEIGMGDNIYLGDRNGVRTPMQWSPDRNAGFSRANPQRLYLPTIIDPEYHYEAVNVEGQQKNPNSLLWWMKRLIDLRKQIRAFGRGTIEFLQPENRKILAFIRSHESEQILVVANLSRFVQSAELDLGAFKGRVPVELFGRTAFPAVGDSPYFLTLNPHSFYWLALENRQADSEKLKTSVEAPLPAANWNDLLEGSRELLEKALARFIPQRRWFAGKARDLREVQILDTISFARSAVRLVMLKTEYREGSPETYLVPLALSFETGEVPAEAIVLRVASGNRDGLLYEAPGDPAFAQALLSAVTSRKRIKGSIGEVRAVRSREASSMQRLDAASLQVNVLKGEQSNTSIVYGDKYFLKLFRKIEPGVNTDVEMTRFLTEQAGFPNIPSFVAALEYHSGTDESSTLAIVQEAVPKGGDAWALSLDAVGRFFDRITSNPFQPEQMSDAFPHGSIVRLASQSLPPIAAALLGPYVTLAGQLGQRTAEMHVALASDSADPAFAPEPFTPFYRRSMYQSLRTQTTGALQLLKKKVRTLPENVQPVAEALLSRESEIDRRCRELIGINISALRIRCHGDYHLGQVLYTGKDFIITDFEGEPSRPLSQRRIKRSPLKDVAGMIRSFDYVPNAVLFGQAPGVGVRAEDLTVLRTASRFWSLWSSATFLRSYLASASAGSFLPTETNQLETLLDAYLLEKAFYEIVYELNQRPAWVEIPIRGILQLLEKS